MPLVEFPLHNDKRAVRFENKFVSCCFVLCQDGASPEEVVKFGSEYIELDSWARRRQYTALKDVLGTGVTVHLQVKFFSWLVLFLYC